jgi:hypothetical protein
VVKQLDGTPIENASIIVRDLGNGSRIVSTPGDRSGPGGVFSVSLPPGTAVSVTFTNGGVNLDASLIGISGDTVLTRFPIFMPVAQTIQPQYNACGYYYLSRCRLLCRRNRH